MDMEVPGKRVEISEVGTAEDQERLCELCEDDHVTTTANGICRECEEFMCNTCFRVHLKAKLCKHHVLIDSNESLTQKSVEDVQKCKKHANERIKYYCRNHETVGCGDCMIPGHFACKPENIHDLSKEFERNDDFKSIMAKIEELMSSNSSIDKNIQDNKKENQRMLEEALHAIQNFRSEVNKYLDKAAESIIKEVKKIERKNDKLLVKLEQDCKLLSSKIMEVTQKLDTGLYKEIALFIQSVECKPTIADIEKTCTQIQTENEITTFEFIPDKQLQGIVTSIESLGQVTGFKSSSKAETTTQIKQISREDVKEREKPTKNAEEKEEECRLQIGGMQPAVCVGARVRAKNFFSLGFQLIYVGQLGTVTAVHPDGKVDVNWDGTGIFGPYTVGENGDVELI